MSFVIIKPYVVGLSTILFVGYGGIAVEFEKNYCPILEILRVYETKVLACWHINHWRLQACKHYTRLSGACSANSVFTFKRKVSVNVNTCSFYASEVDVTCGF
jgi:hypothetical protein